MNEGVTEGRTEGQKDGTYSAGSKDSASAYVLCPRFNGTVVSFYLEGGRNHGEGLRKILREMRSGKECGKMEHDRIDTSWFSS